jgi:hypothetical protein
MGRKSTRYEPGVAAKTTAARVDAASSINGSRAGRTSIPYVMDMLRVPVTLWMFLVRTGDENAETGYILPDVVTEIRGGF